MIPRYALEPMARLFADEERYATWLEVEVLAVEALAKLGLVPAEDAAVIRDRAGFDVAAIEARERVTDHDAAAFVDVVQERVGGPAARWIHHGLTSSDVVDTALAVTLVRASDLLVEVVDALEAVVATRAREFRATPMVGRTHGIHAEPTTFGLKCLGWSEELGRDAARLAAAVDGCAVGKFSGAVGTLAHLEPAIEVDALSRLGLTPEPVATQVVQRDRHAALLCALAVLAGSLERVAVEVRHLQRSEVREAEEPFGAAQKGSSAMPHKRNPVRCERVAGLARLVRGYAQATLENQALWHERDISHSSVERVVLPDAFEVADFMTAELTEIVGGLTIHPEAMRRNLESGGGLVFSQRVLLALTEAGLPRDTAYAIVQEHAVASLDRGAPFRAGLEADPRVAAVLDGPALAGCFTLEPALRHVDALFARAGRPA